MNSAAVSTRSLFSRALLLSGVLTLVPWSPALAQTPPPATSVRVRAENEPPPNPAVTVSPPTVTMVPGSTQAFTALVTGTPNQRVTWTATGGTIATDGIYTAPMTTGAYRVIATITGGTIAGAADVATTGPAAVEINPGQDVQAIVAAAPLGSTFLLKAGVHRLQTIRPRDGDTFTGEMGTVLSGARLLTMFTRSGSYWVASDQTQQGTQHGECQSGYPQCGLPEQLFIDDQPLLHVGSLGEVGPGTWYFDYAGDRIYFADDPTGHKVETSVTTTAIEATANNVTVSGLTVEKYANLAQNGAINADGKSGWVLSRNEVRWNHGLGIRIGPGIHVLDNNVHHNGQLGIGGTGSGVLVEGNEIAYNNTAHFDAAWEAGGSKFVLTVGLIVRRNFVHHNGGPGLWTDIDNTNSTYEDNTVEDNERMGIFHEISYAAIIRNNIVRRNGFGFSTWMWGAGILVAASPNVEISGNVVDGNADGIGAIQQNRGSGAYGPHEVSNLWVHDNTVTMTEGWTGLVQDVGDTAYFSTHNNRFDRNRYQLGAGTTFFTWMNAEFSESQWKSYGEDVNGTFSR